MIKTLSRNRNIILLSIISIGLIYFLNIWVINWTTPENIKFYQNTGTIGDTIGGLTAPVIGLLSTILIYISFREQRIANQIQIKALEKEKFNRKAERWYTSKYSDFIDIVKKFNGFTYTYINLSNKNEEQVLNGYYALVWLQTELAFSKVPSLDEKKVFSERQKHNLTATEHNLAMLYNELGLLVDEVVKKSDIYIDEYQELKESIQNYRQTYLNIHLPNIISLMQENAQLLCNGVLKSIDNMK